MWVCWMLSNVNNRRTLISCACAFAFARVTSSSVPCMHAMAGLGQLGGDYVAAAGLNSLLTTPGNLSEDRG